MAEPREGHRDAGVQCRVAGGHKVPGRREGGQGAEVFRGQAAYELTGRVDLRQRSGITAIEPAQPVMPHGIGGKGGGTLHLLNGLDHGAAR